MSPNCVILSNKKGGMNMPKTKDSKNQTEFKETENIKRNLPKNPDFGIPHNANKESLGPNTKR